MSVAMLNQSPAQRKLDTWRMLATQLRVDSIRQAAAAGSGHPTSALSAADLMAVLLESELRFDFQHPDHPLNDELIFSKGHASVLLYAMYRAAGAISEADMLTFASAGSALEAHPRTVLPWVHATTGSLGQGLPIGVGAALAGRLANAPYRVWVLCGDGEMAEGSMWEAFEFAGYQRLGNLTAIVDVNRLAQRGPTMHGWDIASYQKRLEACGWDVQCIDGHDLVAIADAYAEAEACAERPTAILARTVKGNGVAEVEDRDGFHGRPLAHPESVVAALGGTSEMRVAVHHPASILRPETPEARSARLPEYPIGTRVSTRRAYGDALVKLGAVRPDLVVLDAGVGNSTYADLFAVEYPERHLEMFIAEQLMVGVAVGLQSRGLQVAASIFAAFACRAHDFIRLAGLGGARLSLCGSHGGLTAAEAGPTGMGLDDLAMMRCIPGSAVLYPSDAVQAARLTVRMLEWDGVAYMRTTRSDLPVIYAAGDDFQIGGSRILMQPDTPDVCIATAGVCVHEALRAAHILGEHGVRASVLDLYSIKPLDESTLLRLASECGQVVTVEDNWPEGGLGEAVAQVLAGSAWLVRHLQLAVRKVPGSSTPAEAMASAGVDANGIVAATLDWIDEGTAQ